MFATIPQREQSLTVVHGTRRRRRRGPGSNVTSSAGRDASASDEVFAVTDAAEDKYGMFNENRFAFLSSAEPAPGAIADQSADKLSRPTLAIASVEPKYTASFTTESTKSKRRRRPAKRELRIPQVEPLILQPAPSFAPKVAEFGTLTIKEWPGMEILPPAMIKHNIKELANYEVQPLKQPHTAATNPHLLPHLFPSIAPLTNAEPSWTSPTPPARATDGPTILSPHGSIPATPLTPPATPPLAMSAAESAKLPSVIAEAWPGLFAMSSDNALPEIANEPMAPATKDRKSRFFPRSTTIVPFATTEATTSEHNTSHVIETYKKGRMSPPSPLDLVGISLASPIHGDSPVLVHTDTSNDTRGETRKNSASWRMWGNDMSNLRLKTAGFINSETWASKLEEMDTGADEIYELLVGDGDRKWSFGEEWEVVEVE